MKIKNCSITAAGSRADLVANPEEFQHLFLWLCDHKQETKWHGPVRTYHKCARLDNLALNFTHLLLTLNWNLWLCLFPDLLTHISFLHTFVFFLNFSFEHTKPISFTTYKIRASCILL